MLPCIILATQHSNLNPMKIKFLTFCFVLFSVVGCFAQQGDSSEQKIGTVRYFQSDELDRLSEIRKATNQKKCPDLLKGYRVQIFSCSGIDCLEKIESEYQKVSLTYGAFGVSKIWEAPSHKLRIGNCRNRFAAEEIKYLIKNDYASVFIVPDFITSPYKLDCEK